MTAAKIRFLNAMLGILTVNATGRANAMTRSQLEARLNHFGYYLTDRKYREAYAELPLCSCEDGLYIPSHSTDLAEVERYWRPKMGPELLAAKMERLRLAYPDLAREERVQPGLFGRSAMAEERA